MCGTPRRQLERHRHARAARPHHHLRRQLLQRLGILWRFAIAAGEVKLLKVSPGAELARPEERHKVVELPQIVLQWRRGEEQQIISVDLLNESIRGGAVILDLVCLIDDDEVPALAQYQLCVTGTASAVVRRDGLRDVLPVIGNGWRGEAFEELALELPLPLYHQGCRGENEHATHEAANEQLLEDDAGLDRLAEPDLVSEDGTPSHVTQNASVDLDLMGQLLDGIGIQGDQSIEAGRQGDLFRLAADGCPEERSGWRFEAASEFRQRPLVDGPEVVLGYFASCHRYRRMHARMRRSAGR